jgi:hypothetical protein
METLQEVQTQELALPDGLPEFPRLNGPLGELVNAITPDIPYEHKALAAITFMGLAMSGRTQLAPPYERLQPRFYSCFIGPPGSGKSAAQNEVTTALNGMGGISVERSINSGPALVVALDENRRLVYVPDEITGAFKKAQHGKMFDDFKTLYEDNRISNRVKAKVIVVTDCHFSIIGTCTREAFGRMWARTGGGSDGLQSRFVLSFSEKLMPRIKTPNSEFLSLAVETLKSALDNVAPVIQLPETVGTFTFGLTGDGTHLDPKYSRVVDMGRRFALVVAACNGLERIDSETMELAKDFINYQAAAYAPLMPPDGFSAVQVFENRLISFFKKHQPASFRDARNNIKPDKSPNGFATFTSAFNSLVKAQILLPAGESNRVGTMRYKLDATYKA